jgi:6-phosphogluconolactonase/glucosamine-6-phosphate isomerase/deaminase
MIKELLPIFRGRNVIPHDYHGILTGTVNSEEQGILLASSILYALVDEKTVVYLSGGRTPKHFYELVAREEKLLSAVVGLIDERYGKSGHENSNERMIAATGLLRYLQMRDIRFYPILSVDKDREATANTYDGSVRAFHTMFPKSLGVLGIGLDGHTAGIPAQSATVNVKNTKVYEGDDFVSSYNDTSGHYGERVTMTFLGLTMLDVLLVLVFGEDKKHALEMVFSEGSEKSVPGRFYKRPEIAKKTILITDQQL